jgi:hypothetical protein
MSESQVRFLLRIPAKLKASLTELAELEHRSLNKQIEYLLDRAIHEEREKQIGEIVHRRVERKNQK